MSVFKNDGKRSDKHSGIFSDLQYGIRAFQSTADILTVLSERIYNSLGAGGDTRAIALDIAKAFDKVWHVGLLHKLKAYGVVGPILCIFFFRNVH